VGERCSAQFGSFGNLSAPDPTPIGMAEHRIDTNPGMENDGVDEGALQMVDLKRLITTVNYLQLL